MIGTCTSRFQPFVGREIPTLRHTQYSHSICSIHIHRRHHTRRRLPRPASVSPSPSLFLPLHPLFICHSRPCPIPHILPAIPRCSGLCISDERRLDVTTSLSPTFSTGRRTSRSSLHHGSLSPPRRQRPDQERRALIPVARLPPHLHLAVRHNMAHLRPLLLHPRTLRQAHLVL